MVNFSFVLVTYTLYLSYAANTLENYTHRKIGEINSNELIHECCAIDGIKSRSSFVILIKLVD